MKLSNKIATGLTENQIGQSTCIRVGEDPITGLNFIDTLEKFREDLETKAVVIIGEIGSKIEEVTAEYIARGYPKPVVAFIIGRSAPPEKRKGYADAIAMGNVGTAVTKITAFENAGVKVADKPSDVAELLAHVMATKSEFVADARML